jgi:small subunit ribosomal protein S21
MQVLVRDNNVDQALKVLKKKMQREGVFREMKLRGHYEKPSEKRVREKAEAIRRARKLARKKLQREGLLPMKPRVIPGASGRGAPPRAPRFWSFRAANWNPAELRAFGSYGKVATHDQGELVRNAGKRTQDTPDGKLNEIKSMIAQLQPRRASTGS